MSPRACPWLAIDSHPQWEFQRCSLVVVDIFSKTLIGVLEKSHVIAPRENLPNDHATDSENYMHSDTLKISAYSLSGMRVFRGALIIEIINMAHRLKLGVKRVSYIGAAKCFNPGLRTNQKKL